MIDKILNERGLRYGKFVDVAKATKDIQSAVWTQISNEKMSSITPDQSVAINMICHKIARIVVGNPDYDDNWIDIAGYAQLVADRLKGIER